MVGAAPVPGLARGLELLRHLATGAPRTLQELAAATGYPKASTLRMLETLRQAGVVRREEETRRYRATARLLPLPEVARGFPEELAETLSALAGRSGFTAEWWEPTAEGMKLASRAEPPGGEVAVKARPGFLRRWQGELDAVACLGQAFAAGAPAPAAELWNYAAAGQRRRLTPKAIREAVRRAHATESAADAAWNSNGIRRLAAACRPATGPTLRGVLSLALTFRPDLESRGPELAQELQNACQRLAEI